MTYATNLTAIGLLLLTCIGCGGDTQPVDSATDAPPPAMTSPSEDVSPQPADNTTVPPPASDGPGSGSEFDVPPNLGEAPAEGTSSPEDAQPEFKLPPADGN